MEEKVHFKDSKGNNLCGIISNPFSDKKKPIVILCHGFSSSKEGRSHKKLEEILNKNNISTFRFDFYGHGESEGKFEDITVSKAIDGVLNAIHFVKKEGYNKIGLIGGSFGGLASMVAASRSNDLFILSLKSPISSFNVTMNDGGWKKMKEDARKKGYTFYTNNKGEARKLNHSFFEEAEKISGYDFAGNIKIPTLIVHGEKDELVNVEQSKKTARLIPNCRIEIIDDADHRYTNPEHFEKTLNLISQFIIKNT